MRLRGAGLVRWRLRLGTVGVAALAIGAMGAPPPCSAQAAPSPRSVLQSWQSLIDDFPRRIHSYRLEGRTQTWARVIYQKPALKLRDSESWSAINAGSNYLWSGGPGDAKTTVSYDGSRWYQMVTQPHWPPHLQIQTRSDNFGGQPVRRYLQNMDLEYPFELRDFLGDPRLTGNHTFLPGVYRSQERYLVVSGPEPVAGARCYHLRYTGPKLNVPRDVWLAIHGSRLVPWRLKERMDMGPKAAPFRAITMVDAGQDVDDVWYPTAYTSRAEVYEDARWQPLMERRVSLTVSDVNRSFPRSTFSLDAPAGSRVTIDNVLREVGRPPTFPANSQGADTEGQGRGALRPFLGLLLLASGALLLFRICRPVKEQGASG